MRQARLDRARVRPAGWRALCAALQAGVVGRLAGRALA